MTAKIKNQETETATDEQSQINDLEDIAAAEMAESDNSGEETSAAETPLDDPKMDTGQMITALLIVGFDLVASRRGPHWKLKESEALETGKAVGTVLDKYFPDMTSHGPEITAVMACTMVMIPRLHVDKQIRIKQREIEANNPPQDKAFNLDKATANAD